MPTHRQIAEWPAMGEQGPIVRIVVHVVPFNPRHCTQRACSRGVILGFAWPSLSCSRLELDRPGRLPGTSGAGGDALPLLSEGKSLSQG